MIGEQSKEAVTGRLLMDALEAQFWPIMARADGVLEIPVNGQIVTLRFEKIEDACPACDGSGILHGVLGRIYGARRCPVCNGSRKAEVT